MNLTIEKSLFNCNVNSHDHNPKVITNDYNKNIKNKVIELLNSSSRIDIAVSYSVWSGLSLIYSSLKKFDDNSRIIVTTEGEVTDPRSLRALKELPIQSKVYDPSKGEMGFHLKTYLGENNENSTLLIGSSNISSRAFGLVHEMAMEVKANCEGQVIKEYKETFENLWNNSSSKQITDKLISDYTIKFKEVRKISKQISNLKLNSKITPNYMQEKALEELEECRKYHDRGLVVAATGTGKTYLSAFDVKYSNSKKTLFLVHNRLILTSAIETFKKIFPTKKILELKSENTKEEILEADLIFTTDKTAYTKLHNDYPSDLFDYIVYDEAHKIGEGTKYQELIEWFTPRFTLGITATPERSDNPKYLFETFKYNVPYEIRLLDAMNHQLICPFTYYGYDLDERLLKTKERFDYEKLSYYLKGLIEEKGHYGEKLKGIIFCKDIKEANDLSAELTNIGIRSKSANETHITREKIEKYIIDLKSDQPNTLEIICVVNKFNEGVDIPDINTIIMLRNTSSSIIYLQQLGRGLRKTDDPHKYVTVFDIIGNAKGNYSIAEVLTGNTTVDKRKLYSHANKGFKTVSPFINVEIQEEAMENIIKSISNDFKVETRLKEKFRDELYRFFEIPTLLELYTNPNFKELELLQLLLKNFYDAFESKYFEKYNIKRQDQFLSKFFGFITQFIFRAYDNKTLSDYSKLLKGETCSNETLISTLTHKDDFDGISSAIKSDYYRSGNDFPRVFILREGILTINPNIFETLKEKNAYELFLEHIELIDHLSETDSYTMEKFSLIDKGEYLFNSGAKDCYMNAVGEKPDHLNKKVYCPITISSGETFHDNYILDENKIVYLTQASGTEGKANEKLKRFIDEGYEFYICAKFPHLKYSSTSFFNMGKVKIIGTPEPNITDKGKYNHKITFELDENIPQELIQYKSL